MNRAFFYPAGREKTDAIGALDLALWDIKGKSLGLPGAPVPRRHGAQFCECYNTAGMIPGIKPGMSIKERARADDGSRLSGLPHRRHGPAPPTAPTTPASDSTTPRGMTQQGRRRQQRRLGRRLPPALRSQRCHPRLQRDQDLAPYFVEDPVRTEAFLQDLPILRSKVRSRWPLAKNGATAGTSIRWLRITTSTTCAPHCPTSAALLK